MWENSRSKNSGFGGGKKKRPRIHMVRTHAQIWVIPPTGRQPVEIHARLVLNDLAPEGALLFSAKPLEGGQWVQVQLSEPAPFLAQGRVTACAPLDISPRVQTAEHFLYRVRIDFSFQNAAEKDAVIEYCNRLAGTILAPTG